MFYICTRQHFRSRLYVASQLFLEIERLALNNGALNGELHRITLALGTLWRSVKDHLRRVTTRPSVAERCSSLIYLHLHIYLRIENAEGYVLIAVYLFIYLFVCVLFAKQKKFETESHEIWWDDWLLSGVI